jgi:carboxypeptidase Taq
MKVSSALKRFYQELDQLYLLGSAASVCAWDMRVGMPTGGAGDRSKVLEQLSVLMHQKFTSARLYSLTAALFEQVDTLAADDALNVKETFRQMRRARKVPKALAAKLSRLSSELYQRWTSAKAESDFGAVAKPLEKLLGATLERCEQIGYTQHAYEVLLEDYEPGVPWRQIVDCLRATVDPLRGLVREIGQLQSSTPRTACFEFSPLEQQQICFAVGKDLGFTEQEFALATSPHPFSISIGRGDTRVTIRYSEDRSISSLYTMLHEMGHALYSHGLPLEHRGRPRGDDISLGVHESQSRFWENIVGRSRSFSRYLERTLQQLYPQRQSLPSAEQLWSEANTITPSLIRVEADEVTYGLHIVLRMELELSLCDRSLSVKDLPEAWNAKYQEYLGLRPKDNRQGVLQDVHWYQGLLGYFPTYALGNLYNTAFTEVMRRDIGDFDLLVEAGNFGPLREWLRERIHQHGQTYSAAELMHRITGQSLSAEPFYRYLRGKFF